MILGIGDWGLGIGDWGLGPIPNPQSPIPNPQSPIPTYYFHFLLVIKLFLFKIHKIKKRRCIIFSISNLNL